MRQIGFGLASYSFWMLPRQMGQEIYAPDLSRVTIAEPAARQALQWLIDVRAKYRVALPSPVVKTTQALSLAQGNLAMRDGDGLFNVSGLRGGAMADDWDVVPATVPREADASRSAGPPGTPSRPGPGTPTPPGTS